MSPSLAIFILAYLCSTITLANPDTPPPAQASEFSFALIGDMPYQTGLPTESAALSTMRTQINADKSLSWVIHAGDIKTGGQPCSNIFLTSRKAYFDTFSPAFIYTPGDNEWTDCHRRAAGNFDPLERLTTLRSIFFAQDNKKMRQASDYFLLQSDNAANFSLYRENALWQKARITFATIHVVGSDDGMSPFASDSTKKRSKEHDKEVSARKAATLHWLKTSFEHARKNNATGIFITIHANPGLHTRAQHTASKKGAKAPFKDFLLTLQALTTNFNGQVVLAHGDSHIFRVDQPALTTDTTPKNFLRVETFGYNDANWIKVTANSNSPAVFSFTPVLN